ncbi:uncharacterized protein si:ch211-133n4.6 [Nematolebias whitei]|uniref:uncharacterized protein si:ch211-133n4.6 n=1 Tax=Nematolebias whitei TaxID=451745 RepID=UPI00189B9767|nr:uncharacterized protein si:ch211-133n4.6 [Nematolebias whitei]
MLIRNVVLLFSLFVLAVEGDSNDAGIQAMLPDKDSLSDDAPTESMNIVSSDQPDESQFYGGGPSDASSSSSEVADTSVTNQMTAPEPVVAAATSVEEEEENESTDSEEGGKKKFSSRSAKVQNSAHIQQNHAHIVQIPALPPHPLIPQPKTLVRNRASKRRSRTNRRQI